MAKKKAKTDKDRIIGHGEVTGHAHRCLDETAQVEWKNEDECILHAPNGTPVTHEEHGERFIPPTDEKLHVFGQKEVDPLTDQVRAVQD